MHILKCMSRLSLRDAELVGVFINVIVRNFHQYSNPEKLLAMSCIGACWRDDEKIFRKLNESGLDRMLSSRDENMQMTTLTVLNKIFKTLKEDEVKWVVKRIVPFSEHEKEKCRVSWRLHH